MANVKISALPAAGSIATTDYLPCVIGGTTTERVTVALIRGAIVPISLTADVSGVLPIANQAAQTMGGDVTGTTGSSTVAKANGATVPAAGALTTGNVLYVSGASALSYGALNLAGGGNYVTGVLPIGNVASPSGTGLAKVSGGAWVSAAATLVNADVSGSAAIAYSKLGGTGTESIGPQAFQSTIDTKGTETDVLPKHVQTTNASTTTLDTIAIPSNSCVTMNFMVSAIRSDHAAGGGWSMTATFKNNGGTVTQLGSTTTTVLGTLDDATWGGPSLSISGANVLFQVTGKAATTIQWGAIYTTLGTVP